VNQARDPTLSDALRYAEDQLRSSPEFAQLDEVRREARAVLSLAARISAADIYANAERIVDGPAWERLCAIVQRRCAGEPLAYIEGLRGFHAIELRVDRNVLVPRPETELIVDAVLERAPSGACSVADLGTGSGAIVLAIAHARPDARVTGSDVSVAALATARANARRLGHEIEWVESDWFMRLSGRMFDFLCCNPPYIPSADPHLEQLQHEPRLALDGGADGLDAIRTVLASAGDHLAPGGRLLLEHGYDQAQDVALIAKAAGLARERVLCDLAGHQRVSVFIESEPGRG
jgi:release factor glutamine methyltransferase